MRLKSYRHPTIEHVETGRKYRTYSAAARAIGGDRWGVKRCCNGVQHSHRGNHFRFTNKSLRSF